MKEQQKNIGWSIGLAFDARVSRRLVLIIVLTACMSPDRFLSQGR